MQYNLASVIGEGVTLILSAQYGAGKFGPPRNFRHLFQTLNLT